MRRTSLLSREAEDSQCLLPVDLCGVVDLLAFLGGRRFRPAGRRRTGSRGWPREPKGATGGSFELAKTISVEDGLEATNEVIRHSNGTFEIGPRATGP